MNWYEPRDDEPRESPWWLVALFFAPLVLFLTLEPLLAWIATWFA